MVTIRSRWTSSCRAAALRAVMFIAAVLFIGTGAANASTPADIAAEAVHTASLSIANDNRDFAFPREGITPNATLPTRKKLLRIKTENFNGSADISALAADFALPAFESAAASPSRSASLLPAVPPLRPGSRAPPPAH
jgi:hypothetical protein